VVKMICRKWGISDESSNSDNALSRLNGLHYDMERAPQWRCPACSANGKTSKPTSRCPACEKNLCGPPKQCWKLYRTQENLEE
jgi:rubrerythrin